MLATKYEILSELNKYHDIPDQYIFLKDLEKSIGKEIDRNMLILLDRADEISHTYKKDKSIEAYRILPNGIDYLEEYEDKKQIERLSKLNLLVAFITLVASIIAAVVGIISLTS